MDNIEIRPATAADLPAVLALYAQLDADHGKVLSVAQAQDVFERISSYPNYKVYVAVAGSEVIGTFELLIMDNLAHMGAKSGVVEDVVVSDSWQGRGIGKRMMEFALERCREAGCYKMALSSNQKREAAHRFYDNLGFERHGYSFRVLYNDE
jgi:GNAT superfamily N-acetyltransferase